MYLQVVLKPCIWANFPRGQSMQKNWVNSALYFIRNKWPLMSSPLDLFSPPIPLCLSLPGFIFQNTITCALPEILTCVSSVLLRNVHTWINVCCLSTHFYAWVNYIVCLCFWMRTWLNLCKMMPFLCYFAENTEQIGMCLQTYVHRGGLTW